MASIFVSAGHGGFEGSVRDSGAIAFGTTEAQEMILTRDLVVAELQRRGLATLWVPDILSLAESLGSTTAASREM
jgi:N-acetylmuramoyl-L-alanine amidase